MVTMLDIAKHCGVSVTTVSRVLSNIDYPVSEKSRECVLKSADQLGYQMNYLGRFLKNNHTNDIGVIIPDITNDFYARLVSGIQDSLLNSENNFLLSVSYRNVEYEKQLLNNMLQRRVRGIILASVSSSGSFFKKINTDGIPIVSVGNLFGLGCHEIDYCYYESGEMVAKYLLDMGHTRVAVMNMRSGAKSRRDRVAGFVDCYMKNGIELGRDYIRQSDFTGNQEDAAAFRLGYSTIIKLLSLPQPPTAVFCVNDMMAFGALRAISEKKLKVPDDISIVGFGNSIISGFSAPQLTTVEQDIHSMGVKAVEMICSSISDEKYPLQKIVYKPKLIIRESSGYNIKQSPD